MLVQPVPHTVFVNACIELSLVANYSQKTVDGVHSVANLPMLDINLLVSVGVRIWLLAIPVGHEEFTSWVAVLDGLRQNGCHFASSAPPALHLGRIWVS